MIYENLTAFAKTIACFSSFVDTTQNFPLPLSKEEELETVKLVRAGDKKARDKLITHNLRLVSHIVKKFPNSLEADDLVSVGTIGLIKAVDSYDPEKGVKFATYASRCIENEILMLIRANKKHKEVMSLSTILCIDKNDNDLQLEDTLQLEEKTDVIDQVEENYMLDKIKKVVEEKLSPLERRVIEERYGLKGGDAQAQREVAKKMDISRSYVSRIEKKAMETLRTELAGLDQLQD